MVTAALHRHVVPSPLCAFATSLAVPSTSDPFLREAQIPKRFGHQDHQSDGLP